MNSFLFIIVVQFAMWGAGHEPSVPSVVNDAINPSDSAVGTSETCENEDELTNYKELMLKNQYELKKKEEELEVIYFFLANKYYTFFYHFY